MKVSQYIFTACGKKKNGDFVVWAKSPDITDAEGEEIHQMMSLKNPVGVNLYEATEEEIRAACPTKYAYFMLSTGKRVLTESNFIGKVYSNSDKRWGNFFIHAYVFDSLDGVLPMSVLGKGLFKSKLEYSEWHDEPCPDSLPQIDITPVQAVNLQELTAFLTPERRTYLLSLLQAVIEAVSGGETVSFNDTEENQKLWYTLIGMLLPASIRENATFANQVTPLFVSAAPVAGRSVAKPVIMRNIVDGTPASVFNYTTQKSMNKPVFDFRNNICAERTPCDYLTQLGECLQRGIIGGLEYVKDIENLCAMYNCGIDEAVPMYMLKYGKTGWFKSLSAYISALTRAESAGIITPQSSAEKIYKAVFKDRLWNVSVLDLPVYLKLYGYGDNSVKDELIGYFLTNKRSYGVKPVTDVTSYITEFYRLAPFTRRDFITYNQFHRLCESGFARKNDYEYNCLIYDAFLDAGDSQSLSVLDEILSNLYFSGSYVQADALLAYTDKKPPIKERLLQGIVQKADPVRNEELLFRIAEAAQSGLSTVCLKKLIDANVNNDKFIYSYNEHYNKNKALFERLEAELSREPKYDGFVIMRETFAFRNNNNVTRADLNAYFKKFYLNGRDNGLYRQKLGEYLRNNSSRVAAAFEVYSDVGGADPRLCDMHNILRDLNAAMYRPSIEEILRYSPQQTSLLSSLDQKLGAAADPKRFIVNLVRDITAADRDKRVAASLIERAKRDAVYSDIRTGLDMIVKNYLVQLLELYSDFILSNAEDKSGNGNSDCLNVYNGLIYPLIKEICFLNEFERAIDKLNKKKSYPVIAQLLIISSCYTGSKAQETKNLMEQYSERLVQEKKVKKLYEEVLLSIPEKYKQKVEEFVTPYIEKKKEGFWSQLFGFKKQKEKDGEQDKDKQEKNKDKKDKKER